MPRQPLIRTSDFPYHITQRSNNREWFYLPPNILWRQCQMALRQACDEHQVKIHAFVLMSNHYHSLVTTPLANLDVFQWRFACLFTKEVRRLSGRINHVFGNRYKWNLIRDERYFLQAYKYIYLNPVRAGITKRAELYKFSTLSTHDTHLSSSNLNDPSCSNKLTNQLIIDDPFIKTYGKERLINWINESFTQEQQVKLKNAFRFVEFQAAASAKTKRFIEFNYPTKL